MVDPHQDILDFIKENKSDKVKIKKNNIIKKFNSFCLKNFVLRHILAFCT